MDERASKGRENGARVASAQAAEVTACVATMTLAWCGRCGAPVRMAEVGFCVASVVAECGGACCLSFAFRFAALGVVWGKGVLDRRCVSISSEWRGWVLGTI